MAKTLRQKSVNQILYISIGSVIAILILFITLFTIFSQNTKKQNIQIGESSVNNTIPSIEQANSQIGKSINQVKNEEENENLSIEIKEDTVEEDLDSNTTSETLNVVEGKVDVAENSSVENNSNNQAESNEKIAKTEEKNNTENTENEEENMPDPEFIKPVDGEIVKQYGKEKLLYSNTLKEWTAHLGIDIKANKTTVVKSSSDGIIKSIKNDPRYGLTVIIEHNNGYASIYSNLLTAEFVTVGENVKSGQTIGTVGNTAPFEIVDDPHLHFEITKDGENIDPEMYIK